ncbi:MAG: NADH-quinone oxidoreductase subunit M [Candidatus Micrarchaeota archaeon]|nr:NADH-quinone oxidoreductase subunit M [Candidatus Micrarchaeota archaeon]
MLPVLPLIVFLPFIFIVPLFLLGEKRSFDIALVSSIVVIVLAVLAAWSGLSQGFAQLSFQQGYIQSIGINLDLELTKYSNIFMVMSAIVLLSAAIVAKSFIKESHRIYNLLFLLTAGSTLGVFLAGNLFLFYVFFEISEISMFFIIYIFGGYDRRYAAIKFLLYSLAASLFLLLGIMVIYSGLPTQTFSITSIISQSASLPSGTQLLAFALLAVAFLIKIPSFPFHGWLPDAHTEAPTTGSMILAGILLKFGGYGLLLMFLMLPLASNYALPLAAIFGFSALYSAMVAMRQEHLKRLIAYTSVVDMGIASLGIASLGSFGIAGGLYAMLSHGIIISLLFLIAGTIDETYGTLLIARLKGIVKNLPSLAYGFLFGVFALIGIPLTSGFIGDLLVFIGAFGVFGIGGVVPLAAVLIMGSFMFLVAERAFFNSSKAVEPRSSPESRIGFSMVFLSAATILLGIAPFLLLSPFAV